MYGLSSSAISDTLGHLQCHSHIARFFKGDFSYSCIAVDKISTDLQRHWVIRLAQLLLVYDLCMK